MSPIISLKVEKPWYMARMQGGRWLNVAASDATFSIQEHAALRRLMEKMPNPAKQYPRVWAFLGSTRKNECLQAIFAENAFIQTDRQLKIYNLASQFL